MRKKHPAIVLGLATLAIGALSWLAVGRDAAIADPMALVPADSGAIARAKTTPIFASPLVRMFVGDASGAVDRLRRACGVEPTEAVDEVVLFGWGGDDNVAHVGVIAHITVEPATLVRCVGRALDAEGLTATRTEIDGHPGIATESSQIVLATPSLFVLGDEATVRRALRVADGEEASVKTDPGVMRLMSAAGDGDIALVGAVPARWREALSRYASMLGPWLDAPRIAIGADLRETTTLRVIVESAQADSEAETIRAGLRVASRSRAPLSRLLSRAQVASSPGTVGVTIAIEAEELAALAFEAEAPPHMPAPDEAIRADAP